MLSRMIREAVTALPRFCLGFGWTLRRTQCEAKGSRSQSFIFIAFRNFFALSSIVLFLILWPWLKAALAGKNCVFNKTISNGFWEIFVLLPKQNPPCKSAPFPTSQPALFSQILSRIKSAVQRYHQQRQPLPTSSHNLLFTYLSLLDWWSALFLTISCFTLRRATS